VEKDYDYITLFLPCDRKKYGNTWQELESECVEWLETHVGKGSHNFHSWLLSHDDDQYQWCYLGYAFRREEQDSVFYRRILFKDRHKALIFKLIWGGA
jgi:hypothetical protein